MPSHRSVVPTLLALASLVCPPAVQADQPTPFAVAAEDAALRGVCFIDHQRGWAVGDHGVILGTVDGGRSWGRQATPVECPLHGVSFVDRKHGWAVGGVTTPYTHSSHGVVLFTDNGGYTWSVLHDPLLPRLRGVRFFSRTHGVAFGESSHASPSGVFETRDGGRHWEALHSDRACDWIAASLPAPGVGLLLDSRGQIGRMKGAIVELGDEPQPHADRFLCATLDREGRGWVAGEASHLRATDDAGQSWRELAADGPIQWRGVEARDRRVWLVGSPGTLIASTEDNGETWAWRRTGVSTPLNAVTFVDDRRGWAVGELGAILATDDGGQHWRAQRQGKSRCAVVVVAPTPEAMPLEMIAKLAASEGYRTAGLAVFAEPGASGGQQNRLHEALTGCGAAYARLMPGFALPRSTLDAKSEVVQQRLQQDLDSDPAARLTKSLALQLAMLRPDVVLTTPSAERGASQLVEAAVLKAAAGADDPELNQLGLAAWKPKRVLRLATHRRASQAGISTSDFDPQLGSSLLQQTRPFRGLTANAPGDPPARLGWTSLAGGLAPSSSTGDPLAGLVVERGGDARRPYTQPDTAGLAALKAQAAKQQEFNTLLEQSAGGSTWANRTLQLTGGLDADAGAQQLLDLAWEYRRAGKSRLAADTFYLLARRYPDHAVAEHALDWMLRYYSSSETATHARAAYETLQKSAPLANVSSRLPAQPDEWAPQLTLAEHQGRALTLSEYVEQARPVMFSDPRLRLALAAAARRQDQRDRGDLLLTALGKSGSAEHFRRCVQAESWLNDPHGAPGKPTLAVAVAAERPLLDGDLSDPCWKALPDAGAGAGGARIRFAQDDQFLYLAIVADKLPGAAYPVGDAARPRDADLRGYDRVAVRLDLDRDYETAFELTVDCRGWTHDACWGDDSWDPRWYVASKMGDNTWTVEAAVPLKELGCDTPPSGAWAVSVERQSPGRPPSPWTGAAVADATPDAYGLLTLPSTPEPAPVAAAVEMP
ncbi:Ycf48-like protein precursor [Posidoniimonas corsicana]|uniref:Ycf48-like protein n=1 Tax=Posidoniimonas corsicana TaxID=1938618 RepID=A0A5C5VEI4_9BACT|nr:YCF48-related protein [Posidoniimonas corsicana]TWT37054.1 Ycf48-like protein precursor [Posidoniimonas corsicana]